ncbi:anthranilate synthase component I [uncultured Eubacterium sp.]|uniref:anthranilate synthase component I n=1 Tax=uncultured Eubacterium sp. TaxID=165185 RepID=UPI00326351FE
MITPKYDEIQNYLKDYSLIPICKEIYSDVITPISLLRRMETLDKNFFLLESVEGGEKWGRYSFLGYNPVLHVSCKDGVVTQISGEIKMECDTDGMTTLRNLLEKYKSPRIKGLPTFTGGFVGYFAYEMIGYTEPKLNIKSSDFDDYNLMLFDKIIAFDYLKQKIFVIANMKSKDGIQGYNGALLEIEKIIAMINDQTPLKKSTSMEDVKFKCNLTKEEYCEMVNKTKNYIKEGDIFQGVISRKFVADYKGSLLNAYRVLRTTNPSPYMYFLQSNDLQIAGASPETMVKLVDGNLTTFPVAGTRPRGKNNEEDIMLEKELLADEKELAEHNMLVDLARNDIGKISEYGSVYVKEYMKIHRFSKVMHIASTVCGTLRNDLGPCSAVEATLPAGTLSGAPKFRACEIIDELEPEARGVYGGAIGYIDLSGNLDVCIAIRTAVKKNDKVYVQAGAGIVADSIPENEYIECENKASAVIEAIKRGNEVNM